jgi:hypothetical protein
LTTVKQGKADLLEIPLKRAEKGDFRAVEGKENFYKNRSSRRNLSLLLIRLFATGVSNLQ